MIGLAAAFVIANQPLRGQRLLDDLSRRAVQFFWEQSNPKTGLTRDRGPNTMGGPQNNARVASIASTGYALAAYGVGVHRGWLKRPEAIKRARLTLQSVLKFVPGNHGWYFHFIDWETGERQWNCEVSSIDSGLLFAGMLMAKNALRDAEYSKLADQVMARVDWHWILTNDGKRPNELLLCHGWKPEDGFLNARWGGFCELMFLYVLAYGYYDKMPAGSWQAWERPEVHFKGLDLLSGGPLFMHQMSQGFYDFKSKRDPLGYDYFVEGVNATLGNRQYCIDNPKQFKGYGPNIWGLSACDVPDGYGAQGAPGWIDDNGTLAPAAAVASVIYTPKLSVSAAEEFIANFPESYGQYGFTTGLNPSKAWRSPDVIGIDLGQMMLNIENARDGAPNKWMMALPQSKRAFRRIGFRTTKEKAPRPLRIRR